MPEVTAGTFGARVAPDLRQGAVPTQPAALDLGDDVADLERRPQLQTHVLHHHVRLQQQQRLAVDLLSTVNNSKHAAQAPTKML